MIITHYRLDSVDSTNTWAKRHASHFAPDEFAIITADVQTAGRGRFERRWFSPKGKNLYLSLAFFISLSKLAPFGYSQLAALALKEVLQEEGVMVKLKWPNDLLVNDKKISGILTEIHTLDSQTLIVMGVGLNINMDEEELATIDRPATSMYAETKKLQAIEDIKMRFVENFLAKLDDAQKKGFEGYAKRWNEELLWMANSSISIQQGHSMIVGKIDTILDDGSIFLQTPDGKKVKISSGEICIQNF